MSYQDGMAALNLEMPPRVPRTEYSAHNHPGLLSAVTGIDVVPDTPNEVKSQASRAFIKAWNYDFMWSTDIGSQDLSECRTDMGHAEYAAGGTDKRDTISCPFKEPEDVLKFNPWEVYGTRDKAAIRKRYEGNYANRCKQNDDLVNMAGIYISCISGLIDIFGWEMLLMAGGIDAEGLGEVTNRYTSWIQQCFDALGDSDVPVVMIHDDIVWTSGPFFHPDWYRKYVFPNYKKLFAPLIESDKKIIYTSDGTYTMFVDDIANCGVNGFVMEPTTDMGYIAEKYGKTHAFIGNADTRILLSGTKQQIRTEVERCMAIGKNCPGFFLAVGNHIPSNTPVENALYYNEVYEELGKR